MAENTLGQWLWHRFSGDADLLAWERLTQDDQDYWEHEARAVTRAVVRGGFKQEPPSEEPGLQEKFFVKKIHDPDGKHNDCRYFVLDPRHDPIARHALLHYATRSTNYSLRKDIVKLLEEVPSEAP